MTRDELKAKLTGLIDEMITEDRELSDEDEDKVCDQFGDVAADIFHEDDTDEVTDSDEVAKASDES